MCKSMDINFDSIIFIEHSYNAYCVGDLYLYIKPIIYIPWYELKFILAHELSHVKLYHCSKTIIITLITYFFIFFNFDK